MKNNFMFKYNTECTNIMLSDNYNDHVYRSFFSIKKTLGWYWLISRTFRVRVLIKLIHIIIDK